MEGARAYCETQAGDPIRAAEAIVAAVRQKMPLRHPVFGKFGYDAISGKLKERLAVIEEALEASLGANFPER